MSSSHYHHDCPECTEEAIRERCPAFRIEWVALAITEDTPMPRCRIPTNTIRVWFKDGNYTDVVDLDEAAIWKSQQDWDYTEVFTEDE